jgi:hypothetical protein
MGVLKVIAFNLGLLLALLAAGLGAGEAWHRARAPQGGVAFHIQDAEIGWVPAPNVSAVLTGADKDGTYPIVYRTNEHGFREWGDTKAARPKVLFIGDSFTGDANTSNDEAYFGIVKKKLPVEVFAIGASGYGTLQELLLARRYVSLIEPDLIVVQFSNNDFGNNSWEVEDLFVIRTQKNYRPYLVNGEPKFRDVPIYRFLSDRSYLFRALDIKLQNFQFRRYGGNYPKSASSKVEERLQRAEAITYDLFKRFTQIAPRTRRFATFSCSRQEPEKEVRWVRAAETAGFTVWPQVGRTVNEREKQGMTVRILDGAHWNRQGNFVAGEVLAEAISRLLAEGHGMAR